MKTSRDENRVRAIENLEVMKDIGPTPRPSVVIVYDTLDTNEYVLVHGRQEYGLVVLENERTVYAMHPAEIGGDL